MNLITHLFKDHLEFLILKIKLPKKKDSITKPNRVIEIG